MRYLYAMNSRPFSPDTYPKEGFLSVKINKDLDDCSYYDLLIYKRKLDFEESLRWELEYIGEFEDEI